ncbi:MAG: helix-turn-helix domain-containing protein, partial [Candidatus Moraniibacteriota bacterium]
MLYRIFDKFGLKKEHSDIYLALLDSGISPTGNLAKRLNMPRSTLYGLLENLAQHGLVSQSEKNKVKMWQAVAPETIKTIINEKINTLES